MRLHYLPPNTTLSQRASVANHDTDPGRLAQHGARCVLSPTCNKLRDAVLKKDGIVFETELGAGMDQKPAVRVVSGVSATQRVTRTQPLRGHACENRVRRRRASVSATTPDLTPTRPLNCPAER